MLDGLLPATCIVVADNILMDAYGRRAERYDLIEYGCAGENRVELRRRHMTADMTDGYAIQVEILERVIAQVNAELGGRASVCPCRPLQPA